ncbi:SRPBCC family protein [Paeniglutamicibacter cryotolerans]|uniref:SRPBCC domain-containing protein n=1 Tax=Paeniglutamicibacter cryotolerans TaxID=670079 RepID=A0A839QHG4_9MICC|nr:SRPBCC family protein [Paeniglutamicibacter cryotolerans]MBB2994184.1 hypothetical protein [Paeniglutamicibacter cryotolerans]
MEPLSVRIEPRATAAQAWDVMTDADGYREWVPEVTGVDGEVSHGQWITLHRPGTDRDLMLHVTASADRRLLRWESGAPLGMLSERCTFILTEPEARYGCVVEIERGIGGSLERLLGDGPDEQRGWLERTAAGLKAAVERRAGLPAASP